MEAGRRRPAARARGLYHICFRFVNQSITGSTGSAAPILTLAVAEQAPEFRPHRRRDVAALERIRDVGGKKAPLRATIEAPAVEFEAIERLGLGELDHRIGELDLTARAAPLGGKNVEDLRLEDVAAGDDEVRG